MTNWYFHHNHGDDANDGLTPPTAKRTQDAVWPLCKEGDTIYGDHFTGFTLYHVEGPRNLNYELFPVFYRDGNTVWVDTASQFYPVVGTIENCMAYVGKNPPKKSFVRRLFKK